MAVAQVLSVIPESVKQMGLDVVDTSSLGPKYEIVGSDMQTLRIQMGPEDKVVAEPGAMVYMHSDVEAGCDSGDCCGRCVSGSPCVMGTFETKSPNGAYVGLTPVRPAKIIPIKLGGRTFLGKDRAYFASVGDVSVGYDVDTNPLTCCCGGQGLIRQKISGDGMAFVGAMGVLVKKTLAEGESFLVDTNSLVAWEETIHFDVKKNGGFCMCCCGGEGMFSTKLVGPGEFFVQSYSHSKFKQYAIEWYLGSKVTGGLGSSSVGGAPAMPDDEGANPLAAPTIADMFHAHAHAVPIAADDVRRRNLAMATAVEPLEPMDRKLV